MAKDAGFEGLTYIYQSAASAYDNSWDKSKFAYGVEMNPQYINLLYDNEPQKVPFGLVKTIRFIKQLFHINLCITGSQSEDWTMIYAGKTS